MWSECGEKVSVVTRFEADGNLTWSQDNMSILPRRATTAHDSAAGKAEAIGLIRTNSSSNNNMNNDNI